MFFLSASELTTPIKKFEIMSRKECQIFFILHARNQLFKETKYILILLSLHWFFLSEVEIRRVRPHGRWGSAASALHDGAVTLRRSTYKSKRNATHVWKSLNL